MKLDCVLTATNDIPFYSDFIPIFVKTWKKLYPDVDIKIVYIAENLPEKYKEYEEHIIMFPPIKGLKTSFMAQYIRLLFPCLLDYENGVLITDMDMLPMNSCYYTDNINNCTDDKFIYMRNVLLNKKQLAMCYNVATPSTWREIFLIKNMEDLTKKIEIYVNKPTPWCLDQIQLYISVTEWNNNTNKLVCLPDKQTRFHRLAFSRKGNIDYSLSNITKNTISQGSYTDFHCPRPYEKYKELIDEVYDLLPSAN